MHTYKEHLKVIYAYRKLSLKLQMRNFSAISWLDQKKL